VSLAGRPVGARLLSEEIGGGAIRRALWGLYGREGLGPACDAPQRTADLRVPPCAPDRAGRPSIRERSASRPTIPSRRTFSLTASWSFVARTGVGTTRGSGPGAGPERGRQGGDFTRAAQALGAVPLRHQFRIFLRNAAGLAWCPPRTMSVGNAHPVPVSTCSSRAGHAGARAAALGQTLLTVAQSFCSRCGRCGSLWPGPADRPSR